MYNVGQKSRFRFPKRRLGGLGDNCVIDATSGQRVCGPVAEAVAGVTDVCTIGKPRYLPPSFLPSGNCQTGQPRYLPATYTPTSSGGGAGAGCTPGVARYMPAGGTGDASTVYIKPPSTGGKTWTYKFAYHSGANDVWQAYPANTSKNCNWMTVSNTGIPSFGNGQPQQNEQCGVPFVFQYHSGKVDVYYCSATNQWATTSNGADFAVINGNPPAVNESQCAVYSFAYHAGTVDVYYAQATNSYATVDSGGNWNLTATPPAADESQCSTSATTVAVSSTGTVSTTTAQLPTYYNGSPYYATAATSDTTAAGYGSATPTPTPAAPTGVLASLEQAWAQLPSWGHYAAIGGVAYVAWKYFLKGGRR